MSFIAGVLTLFLLANSLLLILLVLVQLPKKDAGAGLAFGGGTADALFGAGSGNALTKITKWGTVIFIALAIILSFAQDSLHHSRNDVSGLANKIQTLESQTPATTTAPAAPKPANNGLSTPLPMTAPAAAPSTNSTK
jgi:protein translocase SecG subunit